jgi:hypothetical protein
MEPTEIAKSLDIEVIRNLLGPVTQEVGELLGDIGSIVRFYTARNLTKVFTAWSRQRDGKPLQREEVVRVVPLLHAASLQSDEELHEQWAALLENAVTSPENTLPSFGQTLSQMTAEEARYLRDIFNHAPDEEIGDMGRLTGIFQSVTLNLNRSDSSAMSKAERQSKLLVHDFLRLGLIMWHNEPPGKITRIGHTVGRLEEVFTRSEYGTQFLKAVTPKFPESRSLS